MDHVMELIEEREEVTLKGEEPKDKGRTSIRK